MFLLKILLVLEMVSNKHLFLFLFLFTNREKHLAWRGTTKVKNKTIAILNALCLLQV